MKISYRLRRSTKQYIIVSLICIVMIGGAAIFTAYVITQQIKEEYEQLLMKAHQELSLNQKNVYVAAADIAAGDTITQDKVEKRKVFSSQPQNNFITSKEIGTLALIDIPADTQLIYSMVTDPMISSELREVEYQVINVSSNINSNDTVDIRIFFQNGEDYVVLPKKVLRRYTEDAASCFLWLTEEEIIRIRNAIVDAYLYTGAYLYTTKYIEPNIQKASIVTYTPSLEAVELIRENPNIVDTATNDLSVLVRKALENRLARALNKDITKQQWDINNDYIYQQYNDEQEMEGQSGGPDSTLTGAPDEASAVTPATKEETMGEGEDKGKEKVSLQRKTMIQEGSMLQEETIIREGAKVQEEVMIREGAMIKEETVAQGETMIQGETIQKGAEKLEETEMPEEGALHKKIIERVADDRQENASYNPKQRTKSMETEEESYNQKLTSPDLGAVNRFQGSESGMEEYFMSTEG